MPLLASALYCGGGALVGSDWLNGGLSTNAGALFVFGALPIILVVRREGLRFRANIQWGPRKAASSLLPAALAIGAAALYLWRWADSGEVPASDRLAVGIVMLALSVLFAGVGTLKSTQHRAALAFRKKLASGREFFIAELAKERPALRDEWFPWVLAFGLGKQMDDWSALGASTRSTTHSSGSESGSFSSGESGSSSGTWTGFAGGRSGGGGGGASWAAAASGLSAPIAPPSSSSSGGGSNSSSSSSSSGGSSGGGGGGGW